METNHQEMKLRSVGSSPLYDALYLFAFPPISTISLLTNLLVIAILSARFFKRKAIYNYLRVSCLNSSVVSLIYVITFICDSRRYLAVSNSEFATYFRCYFKIPVINTCYFYGSVLDIVLAIDRLVEFTPIKTDFRRMNSMLVSGGLFAVCLIINVPHFFVFEPRKSLEVLVSNVSGQLVNSTETFHFYAETQFATSDEGRMLLYVQKFVRDILTLIVLILINLIFMFLFW